MSYTISPRHSLGNVIHKTKHVTRKIKKKKKKANKNKTGILILPLISYDSGKTM